MTDVTAVHINVTGHTIPPGHTLVLILPRGTDSAVARDIRDALEGSHDGPVIFVGGGITPISVPPDDPIVVEQDR